VVNEGSTVETVSACEARALLLRGLGLAGETSKAPVKRNAARETLAMIEAIGFVQVDSINVVERAHHHILWSRLPGYSQGVLDELIGRGEVFEQWTHDASVIPSRWFAHWKPRFEERGMGNWVKQRLGKGGEKVVAHVRGRIEAEGPLMAKHFEGEGGGSGGWWEWKPSKAALEHLWRVGELSIAKRVNFHKVYDLTSRVLPRVHGDPTPSDEEHVKWACETALERLGCGTAREIAQFWNAIDQRVAQKWCNGAAARGEIERVMIEAVDGSKARAGFAVGDWRERAKAATAMANGRGGMRLLSPFDPLVRDRARCKRLFGFEYNFEAFVPETKRKFGYYVLPILDGERLIGRLHPKAERDDGKLVVKGVWWEPKVRETKSLRRRLDEVLERYAKFNGVERVDRARG
jgi:uncharacterized protein YcaQ